MSVSLPLQLLPKLYHLGSAAREEVNSASAGPIQEKLESMAGEVTTVMDQQLQVTLSPEAPERSSQIKPPKTRISFIL